MAVLEVDENRDRIGLTFHRSFALVRPAIKQVLDCAVKFTDENGQGPSLAIIRERTSLGTIYVEAMPRYARGTGLFNNRLAPTLFGRYANRYDPYLEHPGTQWIMHYHMSAKHGPGPLFWHHLVTRHFRSTNCFTDDLLVSEIAAEFEAATGKPLSQRSARSTATIFLGSYLKSDAFNQLNLLEKLDENSYQVQSPVEPPPAWAVAYAVFDYTAVHFPSQVTVNLNDLHARDGLTAQFMIGPSRLDVALEAMQSAGLVDNYRFAPPYAVAMLNRDPETCLRRLYGAE